jgi:hypothetical protein
MSILEKYVWCNLWLERTDIKDADRALFIGDSITNAYRPVVNEILDGKIPVDMLATSRAIDDPCLKFELNYILNLNNIKYKTIHFNNGLHGWHLSANKYQECLDKTLKYIFENSEAKVILALSTPITAIGDTTKILEPYNSLIVERNKCMLLLAKKFNLLVNDLYIPMLGKSEYRADDGYHYNRTGVREQAEIVAKIISGDM